MCEVSVHWHFMRDIFPKVSPPFLLYRSFILLAKSHNKSFTNKTVWIFSLPLSIFTIQQSKGVSYEMAWLLMCIILFMLLNIHILCRYDDLKCA